MDKKIAVVTGASRGIGAAIAAALVKAGFFVVGTATTSEGAEHISNSLQSNGVGKVLQLQDRNKINDFIKDLSASDAPLVLVNNAGIARDNLLLRMKEEEWDDLLATNLTGTFLLCKGLVRGMIKAQWGRIINVSSVVASLGNPGQCNYVAAKAGLEGFTRALAREVGSRNITVNAVAPGYIDTDMTQSLSAEQRERLANQIPLNRLGRPEDVANVIAFLVSESADYVTGQTIHVNGGMYMN